MSCGEDTVANYHDNTLYFYGHKELNKTHQYQMQSEQKLQKNIKALNEMDSKEAEITKFKRKN